MSPTLVIASLTLREALRRKLIGAFALITVALVGMSAWGFYRLSHNQAMTSGEIGFSLPQALILFMFMFSFVVALSASAMASPAIATEIESGVLQTVVSRPIRRSQVLLGKWLGLAAVLAAYSVLVSVLEFAVVDWASGFLPPNPYLVSLYLFGEGLALLTLALLLSIRLSALAAGVLGVALFGGAWLAGVVGSLGATFNIGALKSVGQVARYVLPTDGLWHGAIYYLEPQSFATRLSEVGNPFYSESPPAWGYLIWVLVWFVAVLSAALLSFESREL